MVHHTGRRSARAYATPVWGERCGQLFLIQLPYGTGVDWCRNVLAAGGCVLEHHGVRYDAVAPVIVPAAEAAPHLPPATRRMQRLAGAESYLRLDMNAVDPSMTATLACSAAPLSGRSSTTMAVTHRRAAGHPAQPS